MNKKLNTFTLWISCLLLLSESSLLYSAEFSVWRQRSYVSGLYFVLYNEVFQNNPCEGLSVPFLETFNTDSPTRGCWQTVDVDNSGTTWSLNTSTPYEGTHAMRYFENKNLGGGGLNPSPIDIGSILPGLLKTGVSTSKVGIGIGDDVGGGNTGGGNNGNAARSDFLISPKLQVDSTKIYELRYFYKTNASYNNEFEVLLSENGDSISSFTETVVPRKTYYNGTYKEEIAYISGVHNTIHLAWNVVSTDAITYVFIDKVSLKEVDCPLPLELEVKDIQDNEVTIRWDGKYSTEWEYRLQEDQGGGTPLSSGGVLTSSNEVKLSKDFSGDALKADTEYELYVRSKCASGKFSDWVLLTIKTSCKSVGLPFTESFETNSLSKDCWVILDINDDSANTTATTNQWHFISGTANAYEGSYSMRFYGAGTEKIHDDWLISPSFEVDSTKIYQVSYYYKTHWTSGSNEFEVLLSNKGVNPDSFTTVLLPEQTYSGLGEYRKQSLYIQNTHGKVNVAWHVIAKGAAYVFIDMVAIKEVDCIGPEEEVEISGLGTKEATFSWEDNLNSQWEYFVQEAIGGGAPVGSGVLANGKSAKVTRTSGAGGVNLEPDTDYVFYVRSNCGPGKNSSWVGPIYFRTLCDSQPLPFWEGFNTGSQTTDCWMIIDNNKDSTNPSGNDIWNLKTTRYEGTHAMAFVSTHTDESKFPHDDWLISPSFKFDATKYYKVTYRYRTNTNYPTDFRVVLSDKGLGVNSFDKVLDVKKKIASNDWEEATLIIGKTGGEIYIAWHVDASARAYLYLDDISIEELDTCPQPVFLGIKEEKEDRVTIFWTDDYSTDWEYVVQEPRGGMPTGSGTISTTKEIVISQDKEGSALEPNTEYEFYVRTDCANGKYSDWSGPFVFRTACQVFTTPFWEGFNANSNNIECWTIIDNNEDTSASTNAWKQLTTQIYEGTHAMAFQGTQSNASKLPHDDWLVSPKVKFEAGKVYRLKYHYRTHTGTTDLYKYEFEVLASNSGTDVKNFTKVVVPKQEYSAGAAWKEEYVFISGISGEVNIAWHVTGDLRYSYLFIDNIFIEEVNNCPEPLNLDAKDLETNKATLAWTDNMGGTNYEYYVQKEGLGLPFGKGMTASVKEIIVTQDANGNSLDHNTDYEFYVRTDCGDGTYSIWNGPYYFTTLCDEFKTPFWEGFNSDSKTARCWTILDEDEDDRSWSVTIRNGQFYEGDGGAMITTAGATGGGLIGTPIDIIGGGGGSDVAASSDDWLISPNLQVDSAMYVLKFHYRTVSSNEENKVLFSLKASQKGVDIADFDRTLIGKKEYDNSLWKEEIVYFNASKGIINIAWHCESDVKGQSASLYIDNFSLKKMGACAEPYSVIVVDQTDTTLDIEWEEDGDNTEWEVIVVEYEEDETATPIQTIIVTGNPEVKITGLDSGKVYKLYVRSKCKGGNSYSNWSTAVIGATNLGANDNCSGALPIPVNSTLECVETIKGSLQGATQSSAPTPSCSTNLKNDLWFEFTATATAHMFSIDQVMALPSTSLAPILYVALYARDCNSISATPVVCFAASTGGVSRMLTDLIPGNTYYVRIGNYERRDDKTNELVQGEQPDFVFTLCITTSEYTPIEVSPSGQRYSVEELVKDVLIRSNCDLVSNVRYQVGNGSPATKSVNTLGYFNKGKGKSIFPFEEGIVLSTSQVQYVPGPYTTSNKGTNPHRWTGDKDINDAIADAGGGPRSDKRVTQLEFDFIPILDSIHFDYLFASNSYMNGCTYTCQNGALFAAWLIDTTTGEGQNLAKIKGTNTPIALHTIWDSEKILGTNCSSNPELFWNNYSSGSSNPIDAPFNFSGSTIGMSSETVHVVPGRQYHIKLAVMDFCPTASHSSAVFFNAGSFNLGNLDLGADLLVETNNALCGGECATITSGLSTEGIAIKWFKDGVLITGEEDSELEVCESGLYRVEGYQAEIDCTVIGEIKVEIYPSISEVVNAPKSIEACRYSLSGQVLDLSVVEEEMFLGIENTEGYTTKYYLTEKGAVEALAEDEMDLEYQIDGEEIRTVYLRVEDLHTGCYEIFSFSINVSRGEVPAQPENASVCAEYVFPQVNGDQYYYTEPGGQGKEYKVGDLLAESGEHTIYLLQANNDEGCYEETAYQVKITAAVTADIFESETLSCEYYELKPLSEYSQYFTGPEGQGIELYEGMQVLQGQTIYVYASSDDKECTDESSFTIDYEDCPIPRGISPNGDNLNDVFDLTPHGVEDIKIYNRWGTEVYSHGAGYTTQWHGQGKNGKQLPDGTYYYVIIAHGKTRTGWVQINK
ncbi:choice-of-anchor J domain-containing protein [Myroides indicus]|uniref:Cleaved adhesin domain-containing protein n=1 Tax=Myroides indicus TaxID=1323422 RepID=A0A4R7EX38_9FLAO|nr:choice-of-anchor J domain-containing protein [Myroides indicus]TDS57884.1 cleaved adhesin domain-containing protein [Myroides indicus]